MGDDLGNVVFEIFVSGFCEWSWNIILDWRIGLKWQLFAPQGRPIFLLWRSVNLLLTRVDEDVADVGRAHKENPWASGRGCSLIYLYNWNIEMGRKGKRLMAVMNLKLGVIIHDRRKFFTLQLSFLLDGETFSFYILLCIITSEF